MTKLRIVVLVTVAATCIAAPSARAHPGGTDRFGCHVDSSTGLRHCHNGTSSGEGGVPPVFAAQLGLEFGSSFRLPSTGEQGTYFIAIDLQDDGSMLFLANFGGHYPYRRGVVLFADVGLGVAWLDRAEAFFAGQFVLGVKIPFAYMNDGDRSPYVKLGLFADLIADDNPAETVGVAAVVGFTL